MNDHTPTPWQIGITLYPYVHFYGPSDVAGFSVAIGSCVTSFGKENDEANAAFIVKACNAHDELVAALENVRSIISDGAMTGFNCMDGDWADSLFASQHITSAVLKQVKS